MAIGDKLQRGAADGEEIDAVVVPEALVLIGDQHVDETFVDLVEPCIEAPVAVGRGEGAQQLAIAVEHLSRGCRLGVERRRVGTVELPEGGEQGGAGRGADGELAEDFSGRHGAAPHPCLLVVGLRATTYVGSPPPLTPPHKGEGDSAVVP